METLERILPTSITPSVDSICGCGIVIKIGSTETVKPFFADELLMDPIPRFKQLFSVKREWKEYEIAPYVE